ncbi:glycoside hydrolase family 43 protein [Butyrivibrio sp. XBB1001]|uniref:glycoside hydrolase family 43 protein n=1 Tax=Butyrivibrio sp. XBB1001 TaxID=1280682 RepID=UPI00040BC99B|nr:glycoside hydrolase 43 family protein [Butyrivibrio sp. XBB1001]
MKYRNPILFADYSDPDVIRVGDTYYMTASSFNYTPGLPILISKDLVNWELASYALENIKEKRYDIPRHSEGVWAPAIRYHDGMFYIYYGMPDEGYYVVRTSDPFGKWEEPVCILEGKGLIDPCPFWDDDGKAYVIHGYAKSRIGFKSILGIFELSSDGLKAISEDHFIFDGNDKDHPAVTIEGPKVYKRDGYYYIWAPAGGVKFGYQVVLRSKNIRGPYEIKEVMHTGSSCINGPHQGGLVDTVNGDEWFIHFQDRGMYGRICHLQPVSWESDWPIVGVNPDGDKVGEPVFEHEMPWTTDETCNSNIINFNSKIYAKEAPGKGKIDDLSSDSFTDGKYNLSWQWLGNHYEYFTRIIDSNNGNTMSLNDDDIRKDNLCLNALNLSGDDTPIIWKSPNVLTQKIVYPMFETIVRLDATELKAGEKCGVCMTGGQYAGAFIKRENDNKYTVRTIKSDGGDFDKKEIVLAEFDFEEMCRERGISLDEGLKDISFDLVFDCDDSSVTSDSMYFANVEDKTYVPDLKIYLLIGDKNEKGIDLGIKYTPSDHTWVGAKVGIFALSDNNCDLDKCGYARFMSVTTTKL